MFLNSGKSIVVHLLKPNGSSRYRGLCGVLLSNGLFTSQLGDYHLCKKCKKLSEKDE